MSELYQGNSFNPPRSLRQSLQRGWRGQCPACGSGVIAEGYLRTRHHCPHCFEEWHHERCGSALPLFVAPPAISAAMLFAALAETWAALPLALETGIGLVLALGLALWLLPRVKGALIGLEWAFWLNGFDPHERSDKGRCDTASAKSAQSEMVQALS